MEIGLCLEVRQRGRCSAATRVWGRGCGVTPAVGCLYPSWDREGQSLCIAKMRLHSKINWFGQGRQMGLDSAGRYVSQVGLVGVPTLAGQCNTAAECPFDATRLPSLLSH